MPEKQIVLAEKPSVAASIAAVLGANTRKDGYFEGPRHVITYAFGHLVTIAEPETMNPAWGKPWRLEQLPFVPDVWHYQISDNARTQFNIIKDLFCDPTTTSIICATDAGREGEHIFRLIYLLTRSTKPVQRLWISSLTPEAIRAGLSSLRPSQEFDHLAAAAAARSHADWIVGLTFTRAYTVINGQLCTIGRVQTPTLALIVQRQTTIDNFQPTALYEIVVTFEPAFKAHYITPGPQPQTRLNDKAAADAILTAITPIPSGPVFSIVTEEKKTKPPALYDLLTLQKESNKRYGYTAQETLDIAQSLYEEYKILSYPRTESRHLSTDMVDELPKILKTLLDVNSPSATDFTVELEEAFVQYYELTPNYITTELIRPALTKSYVDDTKLTDHHAIIPTHKAPPTDLPEKQRNLYRLVARRFVGIFLPAEVRDETTVIITLADHSFRARGVVIKESGWTLVEPRQTEDDDRDKGQAPDSQQLPKLDQGQQVPKQGAQLKEGKTTPPKPYDDSSLLTAMKNAGNDIDDENLSAYMKQSGLGTPATRAATIERLVSTDYIERKKKTLLPTAKGIALIHQVHPDLKDIALTAYWEQRLTDMQNGKLSLAAFEKDIADFVRRILPAAISTAAPLPAGDPSGLGPCPQCGQGTVRMGTKSASCHRWKEGCTFTIWKQQYGKQLTEVQITELLETRRTKLIKGFKKKDGSGTYNARLVVTEDFKIKLDFDEDPTNGNHQSRKNKK